MKKLALILFVLVVFAQLLTADVWQQSFTLENKGGETRYEQTDQIKLEIEKSSIISRDNRVSTLWQTSDPGAIAGVVRVSPILENTFVQWNLNYERVSLFHDSAVPVWEHNVSDLNFDYPIDMLEDGTVLAVGDDIVLKIFGPDSSTPTWEHTIGRAISGLEMTPN